MLSTLSLWRHWVQAVTMQVAPKRNNIASMCSTVLPALKWASQQARRMIGHGSRKPGTKKWSPSMEQIGHRCLLDGCRTCWMTSVATQSPCSSITRHVAHSMALRRYMYQGADRSRGLHPQPRKDTLLTSDASAVAERYLADQRRWVQLIEVGPGLLHTFPLTVAIEQQPE